MWYRNPLWVLILIVLVLLLFLMIVGNVSFSVSG